MNLNFFTGLDRSFKQEAEERIAFKRKVLGFNGPHCFQKVRVDRSWLALLQLCLYFDVVRFLRESQSKLTLVKRLEDVPGKQLGRKHYSQLIFYVL